MLHSSLDLIRSRLGPNGFFYVFCVLAGLLLGVVWPAARWNSAHRYILTNNPPWFPQTDLPWMLSVPLASIPWFICLGFPVLSLGAKCSNKLTIFYNPFEYFFFTFYSHKLACSFSKYIKVFMQRIKRHTILSLKYFILFINVCTRFILFSCIVFLFVLLFTCV